MTAETARMPFSIDRSTRYRALVERRIDLSNLDLDLAERAISERRSAWLASGLSIPSVTWTDNESGWPAPRLTNRDEVRRPRSLGIRISRGEGEAEVIL